MTKQEENLSHLQAESNEINKTNLVNTLNIMDDEFENQKRAYDSYLKLFYPKLFRTKTIYKDLYNILDRDLDLTKVSLGDYFLAQFVNEVNKSLDRIENEVNKNAQHNNFDKTQKEHLFYHKSLLENRINELLEEYSPKKISTNETIEKQITNPFPEIFKGFDNKNYLLFKNYTEKHIIDKYADYSFIIQKMKKDESRILKQLTHLEIMKWLKENNFINDKDYEIFTGKGSFAVQYLNKADRINNYNLIVKELFPNSLD